jgi:hypothetical protein
MDTLIACELVSGVDLVGDALSRLELHADART